MPIVIKKVKRKLKKLKKQYLVQIENNCEPVRILISESRPPPFLILEIFISSHHNHYNFNIYEKLGDHGPINLVYSIREEGAIDHNTLYNLIQDILNDNIKPPRPDYYLM